MVEGYVLTGLHAGQFLFASGLGQYTVDASGK